ncbi:unnamed protein product, partial [marine sediment metagenome]
KQASTLFSRNYGPRHLPKEGQSVAFAYATMLALDNTIIIET